MAAQDAPHRGQADAGAGELGGAVQALEGAEQPAGEAHVEAGAVVAHEEGLALLRRVAGAAELDPRVLAARRVLPGIADQVVEHDAQQGRVAAGAQALGDLHLDLALGRLLAQLLDDLPGHRAQVDLDRLQRLGRQPRQRQQRVDHAVHAGGRAHDAFEMVVADPVEQVAVVLAHDAGEALDDADRRAQVVRDGVYDRGAVVLGGADFGGGLGGGRGVGRGLGRGRRGGGLGFGGRGQPQHQAAVRQVDASRPRARGRAAAHQLRQHPVEREAVLRRQGGAGHLVGAQQLPRRCRRPGRPQQHRRPGQALQQLALQLEQLGDAQAQCRGLQGFGAGLLRQSRGS